MKPAAMEEEGGEEGEGRWKEKRGREAGIMLSMPMEME